MRHATRTPLLLLFTLAMLCAFASLSLAATPVGKVEQAEGGVSVRREGASQSLKKADTVQVGDVLTTAADGKASVRFLDDTVLVTREAFILALQDGWRESPEGGVCLGIYGNAPTQKHLAQDG